MARISSKSIYPDLGRAFDFSFQQTMSIGPADQARSLSLQELLVRRVYKDALDDDLNAIRQILSMARKNDRERSKLFCRIDPRPDKCQAIISGYPAMRLLDIVRPLADQSKSLYGIAPWVVAAVSEYTGLPDLQTKAWIQKQVCHPGQECPMPYQLEADPLYGRPAVKRPAESTRFQKGQSGNPAGRPSKKKLSLPFDGFLEEKIEVTIDGKVHTLSRIEGLIYQLSIKALKGHKGISKILLDANNAEQLERWKRKEHQLVRLCFFDETDSEDKVLSALKHLKVVNRRTKKFVLLEPWIVEVAIRRLVPHALGDAEQKVVVRATSTPAQVGWPDWWSPNLRLPYAPMPGEPRVISPYSIPDRGW